MTLKSSIAGGKLRFEALLSGNAVVSCDRALLDRQDWLVAPTLGAIIPNWLLVIPRHPVLNLRKWKAETGLARESVLQDLITHLGLVPDEVIWFEHGPSLAGTSVGCGLDHAHLHVLVRPPFDFDAFSAQARAMSDLEWHGNSADSEQLESDKSYFVAGSGNSVISASNVERAGSQFFRRVVSAVVGLSDSWDYKRYAHSENIEQTIDNFRSLEGAANRGK